MPNGQLLATETAFYDAHYTKLLLNHPNTHVLIHGSRLIGAYDSFDDAVQHGVEQFGRGPFLVRRTGDKQTRFSVPALDAGVLCLAAADAA